MQAAKNLDELQLKQPKARAAEGDNKKAIEAELLQQEPQEKANADALVYRI
jgi:hypothetical protein